MSLFDIKPWIVKKKDGTKKQVMPQTVIKGVIGLDKELTSIKSVVENLTGKDLENYVTTPQGAAGTAGPQGPKGDTGATGPQGPQGPKGDYVTTQQLTQSINNSKAYADSIVSALKESLPIFEKELMDDDDFNNIQKSGTYYRKYSNNIIKNSPTNDVSSKSGELIVFGCRESVIQVFISSVTSSPLYIRNYSGSPMGWSGWTKIVQG